MRTGINESSRKEAAFKASSENQSEILDDEEALFIKKLEKGTRKYKGKLPLKCFNCGRIGHFLSNVLSLKKMIVMREKSQNLKRVK